LEEQNKLLQDMKDKEIEKLKAEKVASERRENDAKTTDMM